MALYAIGDLHLSLNSNKSMEVFGPAWENYTERIRASLSQLTAEDVLVLAGDTSWGMSLEESVEDFRFLEQFPCKKYLIKGNHDYWWATAAKFRAFCEANGFTTLELLHNNCFFYGDHAVCGTRGWFLEEEQKPHNAKVLNRELLRLETSLKAAGEKPIFCFLHYPPLYQGYQCPEILSLLEDVQGGALLLRPSPRTGDPPEAGGKIRKYGIFSDLRRLSGVCTEKNLRKVEKRLEILKYFW